MKKACLIALGTLLCMALAAPTLGLAKPHKSKKPCRHGYVRKHGKCRPPKDRVEEIISGDWSGPYTHVNVNAKAKSMSIELNGFPCIDPGHGQFYVETGGSAVTGSLSKSSVGAKGTAGGSYSESTTEGSRNFTWDLTGVFTTRGNFSGKLHIVVDETVSSPNVAPSHCDKSETYVLGYIK